MGQKVFAVRVMFCLLVFLLNIAFGDFFVVNFSKQLKLFSFISLIIIHAIRSVKTVYLKTCNTCSANIVWM